MRHGLCHVDQSVMVFLDIQEKFIAVIEGNNAARVVNNASRLLQAARILDIPVLFTEQYSERLGTTHPILQEARPPSSQLIQKTCFSATDSEEFMSYLALTGRKQVVLCGMEAHVVVLQTALSLQNAGYEVFVAEDTVCSRFEEYKTNGIRRLMAAGVQITNRESILFEWMRNNTHPNFREIVKNLIA
ncbi:hydrolase [Granulosicoccaceae sp. 1_MG-2023]|nr:hydrolase [Granulosicoccaceae sp. 1_MG-2023]